MDKVYRTKSGRVLTDVDIEELASEAERGYDIEHLLDDPRVDDFLISSRMKRPWWKPTPNSYPTTLGFSRFLAALAFIVGMSLMWVILHV